MKSDDVVRKHVLHLLKGGKAHVTLAQAVADFPPEYYNRRIEGVSYSPWQLLEHMRIAQNDILEFIRDPDYQSPEWPAGYWPQAEEQAGQEKWQKTLAGIESDLRALEDMVRDEKVDLYRPLPHAKEYTILQEIMIAGNHNAYHLGQLVFLRKSLGIWSQ